jgi:hypothetical protein
MRPRIVGGIFALVTLLFSVVVLNLQYISWFELFELTIRGQTTNAVIVKVLPETHQYCRYEFSAENIFKYGESQGCNLNLGAETQITYLPENPNVSILRPPTHELLVRVFAILFMSVLGGTGAAIAAERFQNRRKKLK